MARTRAQSLHTMELLMKRFLAVFESFNQDRKREFINIFAKNLDQAVAKWCAMRNPNEQLISIKANPTRDEWLANFNG